VRLCDQFVRGWWLGVGVNTTTNWMRLTILIAQMKPRLLKSRWEKLNSLHIRVGGRCAKQGKRAGAVGHSLAGPAAPQV
jgi:hypothetical protein